MLPTHRPEPQAALSQSLLNLQELLAKAATSPVADGLVAKSHPNDPLMYVYTSGTTGMPKPAVIRQSRYCAGGTLFHSVARLSGGDVVYVTLPIYHANGAIIGVGGAIVAGATVVLRAKFSASSFWKVGLFFWCGSLFLFFGSCFVFSSTHMHWKAKNNHFRFSLL